MTSKEPLPVLILTRGEVQERLVAALFQDPRFAVFSTNELAPQWVALGRRLTGLLVATVEDPLEAFGYAVTACVNTPIVMFCARRYASERKELLEAGAAASLTLPVQPRDLDRVLPLLRSHGTPARVDGMLNLLLDPLTREVRLGEKGVKLTQREYSLLHHLSAGHGRAVPAADLLNAVWGGCDTPKTRGILDVYVFQLRKKLEALGISNAVSTVRGFGYALADATRSHQAVPSS